MKIPFIEMARRARTTRRPVVVLPAIETTAAQAHDLARLYVRVIRVWQLYIRDRILPAYARELERRNSQTTDSVQDIQVAINSAENYTLQAIVAFTQGFKIWASTVEQWHMRRLVASLKYATNVDLGTMMGPQDSAVTIEAMLARNTALIRDVSDTIRGKVSQSVFAGLQARTPVRDVAREIAAATGLQRDRSLRIASDQTVKLSAALDEERMSQLGIAEFEWRHSGKTHYRPEHLARNGKVYEWDDPAIRADKPGWAPFCGCKAKGVIRLDETE